MFCYHILLRVVVWVSDPGGCPINCFRAHPFCGADGVTYQCGCPDADCHGARVVKTGACDAGSKSYRTMPPTLYESERSRRNFIGSGENRAWIHRSSLAGTRRRKSRIFKAYNLRLMVKHQIMEFNKLLEQHVHHMRQMHPTGVTSVQNTNNSHIQSMNQKKFGYASEHIEPSLKSESAHHPMASGLSNAYLNGSSTLTANVASSVNISTHGRRVDASPNMLSSPTTNMPMMQGMNGGMIKSETANTNPASYMFGGERNAPEGLSTIEDPSIPAFSTESNNQPLNDQLLDGEASTFGFLGQIPRNFSLSDLTADFSQSSEILETCDRSPFLGRTLKTSWTPTKGGNIKENIRDWTPYLKGSVTIISEASS